MKCRALVAGVSAVIAVLAMAPAAAASGTAPFAPASAAATKQVWTGYVDVAHANVKLRYVAADFTVPRVTCTSQISKASFWVGLDGFGTKTVEQAGLSTNCFSGQPVYLAFWEMFPLKPVYEFYVSVGDSLSVNVYYDASVNAYRLSLTDHTNGLSFNHPAYCPSGSTCLNTTAEAILEADGGSDLSRFPAVTFSNAQVTSRNGTHGAFQAMNLWDLSKPLMSGSNGPLANVSTPTNNGSTFTFTYVRSF